MYNEKHETIPEFSKLRPFKADTDPNTFRLIVWVVGQFGRLTYSSFFRSWRHVIKFPDKTIKPCLVSSLYTVQECVL